MANYLDFSVKNRQELKDYILRQMGFPLVQVEITNDQLDDCINEAVEEFTKYVSQERRYIALNLEDYVEDEGFTLPDNITSVFALNDNFISSTSSSQGINTLFSVPNQLWNAGIIPTFGYAGTGDWVTYELSLQYVELISRLTGAGAGGGHSSFYFEYNERTKKLTLTPDPIRFRARGFIVIGANFIRPDDQQFGESWTKKYSLALSKIIVGTVRSKYDGTQLLGGATLNTAIKDEGITERDAYREELIETYKFTTFFIG